jgi:hypothetical protein
VECVISNRIVVDMLYDSKWEKKTETQDVYAISTLKAWLERYNPATDYNFHHADNCLLARYFKAHGITDRDVWYALSPSTRMPEEFYNAARGEPWTYGDALERLNACRSRLLRHSDGSCVHEDCACAP